MISCGHLGLKTSPQYLRRTLSEIWWRSLLHGNLPPESVGSRVVEKQKPREYSLLLIAFLIREIKTSTFLTKLFPASRISLALSETFLSKLRDVPDANKTTMMNAAALSQTSLPDLKLVRRGKVRDVYAVDDERLLIVATDRISAFDCILPTAIARKGEVLTSLSKFWFERLAGIVPNHLITIDQEQMPEAVQQTPELKGRSMLVRRTEVFPVECVVRGYLVGSGWKDYLRTGEVCGHKLPENFLESAELQEPIFTPSTKAEEGHDENISEAEVRSMLGPETANYLRDTSLRLYNEARSYARGRGIIIADTKFEFGRDQNGDIILIDEVLTPDSSRFWPAETYSPGKSQPSFDKQFVRDYLETLVWDKRPPAPPLPSEVASATTARYLEAYRLLTGEEL
jgi:phosphoribosylaminoimidazole-succinocarboxamide synthase